MSLPRLPVWVWIVLISTLTVMSLTALASWVLRDQIYQSFLDPGVPYQTYDVPEAPDYTENSAWLNKPVSIALEEMEPVTFFIHPTTYDGGDEWNAPYDRIQEITELETLILPNYAGPFAAITPVYVPLYRQASLYSFMNNREDSIEARMAAYSDIDRAFDQFLLEIGPDRPFILAGSGQGAMHALGLLVNTISRDEAISRRLVAAYLTEAPVPQDVFDSALVDLPPCETPDDVRCVIAFATVQPGERGRIEVLTERSMSWTSMGELDYIEERGTLCINPLLWTAGEDFAPARLHRGGAVAEGLDLGETPSPMANQTGAQCENGLLLIEEPSSRSLRRLDRLGEDRRVPPFNLFYADIQANAEQRLANLQVILEQENTLAPPLTATEEVEEFEVRPID